MSVVPWYTTLIPACKRCSQVDLCKFKANLVYIGEVQDNQSYIELVSKK